MLTSSTKAAGLSIRNRKVCLVLALILVATLTSVPSAHAIGCKEIKNRNGYTAYCDEDGEPSVPGRDDGGGSGDGKPDDGVDGGDGALGSYCSGLAAVGEELPPICAGVVVPDPGQVAAAVWAGVKLPLPAARTAPPLGSDAAVGLPVWVWVVPAQWKPIVKSVPAPIPVSVTATPVKITVAPGAGLPVQECSGPAKAYDKGVAAAAQEPTCSYTYLRSSRGQPGSAYPMAVSIVWRGTWTGPGGVGGTFPNTIATTTGIDVRVAEGQALN